MSDTTGSPDSARESESASPAAAAAAAAAPVAGACAASDASQPTSSKHSEQDATPMTAEPSPILSDSGESITIEKEIRPWMSELALDRSFAALQNACTRVAFADMVIDRARSNNMQHFFSHQISPDGGKVTNQRSTGRCWIFAGMNQMRVSLMRKFNLSEFEFSGSYMFFWDRLEKANYFLELILKTLDEPEGGRLLMHFNDEVVSDGGQYDMLANLLHKYGVVPATVFPEAEVTTKYYAFRNFLCSKLRQYEAQLRDAHVSGASVVELRDKKNAMLKEVFRMLCLTFGTPPEKFDWAYTDRDRSFHRVQGLTPASFLRDYVPFDWADQVCLINSPTPDKPFERLVSIEHLGNVVEGRRVQYINLEIEQLKRYTVAQLQDNHPVWFGCDVGKFFCRKLGALDPKVRLCAWLWRMALEYRHGMAQSCSTQLMDYEALFGTGLTMTKEQALRYGDSKMTHAMVFVGVDLDDEDRPTRFKVENSWGDDVPMKGYLAMSDEWFSRFVYEVCVPKSKLLPEHAEILKQEPLVFPPWDPMGALAK